VIAMDSRGRLFVGDRNNNRIQIFDQEGNFLDLWYQFGRPSGIVITPTDDRIYVADSESFDFHNPGWQKGIRIGSARDGRVEFFIRDLEPMTISHSGAEGIGVDSRGNIYGGVVRRRMLEKFVRTGSTVAPSTAAQSTAPAPSAFAKATAGQALTHLGHITTAFGQSGGLAVTAAVEVNAAMYHANLAAGQSSLDLMKLHTVHVLDVLPAVAAAAEAIATHIELAMKASDASPAIRKLGPNVATSARAVASRAQATRKLASQALAASSAESVKPLVEQLRAMALALDTEGLNPLEAAVYGILEGERLPRILR
jgi:hypothetical protein